MRYGVKRTAGGRRMRRECSAQIHIPYTVHLDDHTIGLKDGSMMQVVAVEGFRFETESFETLQRNVEAFNTLLRGQRRDTHLYTTLVRRKEAAVPGGTFPVGFSRELNKRWLERFINRDVYVNELYLSVIRTDPDATSHGLRTALDSLWGIRGLDERTRVREHMRMELSNVVRTFMNHMHDFGTRRLGIVRPACADAPELGYSEVLQFITKVLNHESQPVALPTRPLDEVVCTRRPYFKHRVVVQEGVSTRESTYGALLSLKEYPSSTWSGMLNKLLTLPHELVVTQSFVPLSNEVARKELETLTRRLETAGEHPQVIASVRTAIGELAMDYVAYGAHHLTIMVTDRTAPGLEETVAEVSPVFTNSGTIIKREDLNLEAAFWAQLPGNFAYIARASTVSTKNMAAFASFHNYSTGKVDGTYLGPTLTVVPTPGDTPYFLNVHVGKLGNTCLFGPTTSGKTTFAAFLISQSQKYGGKTVIIDKDRSWELYVQAEDGTYVTIEPGRGSNMNPLQLPDTAMNRRYLVELVSLILEVELGRTLVRTERTRVESAVHALYEEFEQHERRFLLLHQHLVERELMDALYPWVEGQQNGWLFDNPSDSLAFTNAITGIDVGYILDDVRARAPVVSYLLHRMQEVIDNQELTRIVLEEGWKLIRDPSLETRIEDWERTVRKKNAFVLFSSQDPELVSKAGKAIYEQSATKIFFPNWSADHEVYCTQLGLTDAQYRIVKDTPTHERKVFIRHGDEAVVVVFDLSPMPEILAVLAGTSATVALMHSLKQKHGDRASQWLPYFYEEVQSNEAL